MWLINFHLFWGCRLHIREFFWALFDPMKKAEGNSSCRKRIITWSYTYDPSSAPHPPTQTNNQSQTFIWSFSECCKRPPRSSGPSLDQNTPWWPHHSTKCPDIDMKKTSLYLNTSRDSDFMSLHYPVPILNHSFSEEIFPNIHPWAPPWLNLRLFPIALLLAVWEKRLIPTSSLAITTFLWFFYILKHLNQDCQKIN